jgi:serine/threonine protein kinase
VNSSEPRKSKHELPRGASVGKYEILRKIATGGMAEIYLARIRGTAGFEKLVVLKRILPQVAEDPQFVQMFLDEARLSSTLQHPNIADVYDVGEADGQYFFTMEFVYGQDVRAIRHEMKKRSEPVPLAVGLALVHGAASALDYAHDRRGPDGKPLGVVHRDVSSSNIMVSYDGAVKLLDFGIARVLSTTHKTQVGTLKGKIPYMSPEQCKGLPLDRRSDLFSLGVVLFELTVGRRPFRGDSDFAVMDQIVYGGAPTPSSLMPGYPPELEAIVMKCLEREAKARYTTCDELVEDLEAFTQQFGLWISPKQLGKYMRTVFADKIQAWEDAEKAGVPFIDHVAESITSQSQQSELKTPPSSFPAVSPRPSQSPEVAASLRPTPTSMPAVNPPPSKPVPPKSPTRQILAITAETATKAAPVAPAYTPPAQLPFAAPDKAGEGWDAPTTRSDAPEFWAHESPTMSQPEDDLARALAADPDAGAALGTPPGRLTPPPRSEFGEDQATRKASSPVELVSRSEFADDQKTRKAAPPPAKRAQSEIDEEQITAKPIRIGPRPEPSPFAAESAALDAPAFVPEPAVVKGPAPLAPPVPAPLPELRSSSRRLMWIVLAGVLVIGSGVAGYLLMSGGDTKSAPASLEPGSAARPAPAPVAPVVAPEPARPEPPKPEPVTQPDAAVVEPQAEPPAANTPVKHVAPVHTPPPRRPVRTAKPPETKPDESGGLIIPD